MALFQFDFKERLILILVNNNIISPRFTKHLPRDITLRVIPFVPRAFRPPQMGERSRRKRFSVEKFYPVDGKTREVLKVIKRSVLKITNQHSDTDYELKIVI